MKRAKKRAMHLLEDMDRTESALREKLKAGQYPENAISGAIEYVRSFGYLDDARYAENFVMSRKDTKSKREIKALLSQKGVSDDLICLAFEQCYSEDSEEEAIRRILRKKKVDPERMEEQEYQKILGYLARKGFRYEVIRHVISDYDKQSNCTLPCQSLR